MIRPHARARRSFDPFARAASTGTRHTPTHTPIDINVHAALTPFLRTATTHLDALASDLRTAGIPDRARITVFHIEQLLKHFPIARDAAREHLAAFDTDRGRTLAEQVLARTRKEIA